MRYSVLYVNPLLSLAVESTQLTDSMYEVALPVDQLGVGFRGLVRIKESSFNDVWLEKAREPDNFFNQAVQQSPFVTWIEAILTIHGDYLLFPNDSSSVSRLSAFDVHFNSVSNSLCLRTASALSARFVDEAESMVTQSRLADYFTSFETDPESGCCTDPQSGACVSDGCRDSCSLFRTKTERTIQRYCLCTIQ